MKTRIRILMCYVFSVVSYGRETWTYSKAIDYKSNAFEMRCYRRMLRIGRASHTTNIENWCKRNNYVKQPEQQKVVLCGTRNEKHIRISPYSADNNRRKTGRQARKRETKTNIYRSTIIHSKNKWCSEGPYRVLHVVPNTGPYVVLQGTPINGASKDPHAMVL